VTAGLRLEVRAPREYVEAVRSAGGDGGQRLLVADVERRLRALLGEGAAQRPMAIVQDPTDNERFTALTGPSSRPLRGSTGDGVLRVTRADLVELPDAAPEVASPVAHLLEPWLSPRDRAAHAIALASELNTRHLKGFASVLEPDAPVAASILRAKATVLDPKANRIDPRPAEQRVADLASDVVGLRPVDPASVDLAPWIDRVVAYAARLEAPLDVVLDEVRHVAYVASARGASEVVKTGAPDEVRLLGVLLVRPLPRGGAVVDPGLAAALPTTGREGFVSNAAMRLAESAQFPESSGVASPELVEGVYASTENARPDARDPRADLVRVLRAKSAMQRADKALKRERWTGWYLRRAAWEQGR
jgi:hypothetical protein